MSVPPGPERQRVEQTVATIKAEAPQVIIMDPIASGWRFRHAADGLHPSPAGEAWIAAKVADILRPYGVSPDRDPAP